MRRASFYYYKLSETPKRIYLHMKKHLIEETSPLPYIIPSELASAQELLNAYEALFFDTCSPLLPAMNIVGAYTRGNRSVLALREGFEVSYPSEEDINALNRKVAEFSGSSKSLSPYDLAIYIARFLYENTPYHLRSGGVGESPIEALMQHQSYCTGIARTTRLLSGFRFLCVRGHLRKEFSLVNTEDDSVGTPHVWNAFFDQGEPVFFDICSCIRVANNTSIADELKNGIYRDNYKNGTFRNPTFYSLDSLKKKYVLKEKKLWLQEK